MLLVGFALCCLFHPISLVLPKETGWSPKEKRLWGGGAPVRFRDPPASPTRVGGATRPLRCPLRGRIESLAPGARGLGWQKSSQVKVFCPAFLQKSGRGPGAEPLDARRSARNSPVLMKRRRGSKGEPSPGVPPLRAAPAARSSAASAHRRNAGRERTPGGGGRNVARSAETAAAGRRGRRPLQGGCGDVGSAERGSVGGGLFRSSSPQARNISLALASQL